MKIGRRSGISQSMDLFIIIAAVLGVGGVVTASIYNLVDSATANTSITVVGVTLKAGPTAPTAVSVTVKNNGGSPITCSSSTCQVVMVGTNVTAPACAGSCLVSGGTLTWALKPASGPLTFMATGESALPPGAETSFVVNGPIGGTGTFWSAGEPVTLNVIFGSASAQVTVISQ
ncbi:MAG: hypothetical protein JRN06_02145 [Nitrososphaerota archaeon]|nr:hypothetical protein [Nitrososphaerota archaeon]MDG7023344.1 hypothetical protein [Nitrososphaerota archaeon]